MGDPRTIANALDFIFAGHFDVAEHIAAERAGATRVPSQILMQLALIAVGRLMFLGHV